MIDMKKYEIVYVAVSEIRPAPYNPRKWNDKEYKKLLASVEAIGLVEPIVVNKKTKNIISGNQRFKVATTLGYTQVPVVYLDLSLRKEKLFNIAFNDIDFGFDDAKKQAILDELNLSEEDIELIQNVLGLELKEVKLDTTDDYEGEIQFSPIVHRRQDYVMILFDNNSDFINFVENMNLKNVYVQDKNKKVGVGRVVTYETFLDNVHKFK